MTVEVIGFALMDRIIEMAFFIFFTMLLFSNVITSFSTFYNNKELDFLFSLPIQPTSIYLGKLFENCIYASWATMVLALPLITAYGITTQAPVFYYPVSIVSILIYLIIPATVASLLIFTVFRLFPKLSSRDVIILSVTLIIGLTYLYVKTNNPALLKVFETDNEQELLRFATNLTTVGGTYVPSTWLSNILKGLSGRANLGFFYFALLLFISLNMTIIAFFAAKVLYAKSWILINEHGTKRKRRKSLLHTYKYNQSQTLFFKDLLVFIREPIQWVQLSVFIILLVVYIISLKRTPLYFTFPLWRTIVSFLNFTFVTFVLATLGVRFIFPAISLERAGIWFICSSSLSLSKVMKIKYCTNVIIAVVILESLLILSNLFIKTDPQMYVLMPVIALFVAASLVSINLGLGARFPQFDETNASRIAAGSGGIVAALASIAYVGISIIILATPAYHYITSKYYGRPVNHLMILVPLVVFLILNTITIIFPLRMGLKSLEQRDF
jgi:ABC-2 type transport system permease protein